MPTYGYECKSCGYTFDVFQSMKDDPIKECPECKKSVRRLINGGTGIIFKGSGFYATDKSSSSACESCPNSASNSASSQAACAKAAGS